MEFANSTSEVLFAAELRIQEGSHEFSSDIRSKHLGADAEDVYVVMLYALMSRIVVATYGGANRRCLVGGYACANSRAANEDCSLGLTAANASANLGHDVREIDRVSRVNSVINN